MAFASVVAPEQFQVRSELEVVHLPTGAVFRAYPYNDSRDLLQSVRVNWGLIGAPLWSPPTHRHVPHIPREDP